MEISIDNTRIPCRVTLTGNMTIYAAAALKDRLIAALNVVDALEIDLSEVSDIDTGGIQLLILAQRHAERAGKHLRLVAHSRPVLDLIELYRLGEFFSGTSPFSAGEYDSTDFDADKK